MEGLDKKTAPKEKPLRAKMPIVSAFLDSLREAFGVKTIDDQVRRGVRGEPVFFAAEGGHAVGTRDERSCVEIWIDPARGARERRA